MILITNINTRILLFYQTIYGVAGNQKNQSKQMYSHSLNDNYLIGN